jgi:heat shock protein HslJ
MALVIAATASAAGCGSASEEAVESPGAASRALWERSFVGASVEQAGAEVSLFDRPEEIQMGFAWDKALGKFIDWTINCNEFGTKVRISFHRIDEVETAGTLMGCPGAPQRQDEWMGGFLRSGPSFRLSGQRLLLTAGDRVIVLRSEEPPHR